METQGSRVRGFPSFFSLFARAACNGTPALLQEPAQHSWQGWTQAAGSSKSAPWLPWALAPPFWRGLRRARPVFGGGLVLQTREGRAVGFVLTPGCCTLLDVGVGRPGLNLWAWGCLSSVTSFSVYSLSEPSLQKTALSLIQNSMRLWVFLSCTNSD